MFSSWQLDCCFCIPLSPDVLPPVVVSFYQVHAFYRTFFFLLSFSSASWFLECRNPHKTALCRECRAVETSATKGANKFRAVGSSEVCLRERVDFYSLFLSFSFGFYLLHVSLLSCRFDSASSSGFTPVVLLFFFSSFLSSSSSLLRLCFCFLPCLISSCALCFLSLTLKTLLRFVPLSLPLHRFSPHLQFCRAFSFLGLINQCFAVSAR